MIEDSKKKTFDYVLVYQLDRFARNRYDSANYKAKLLKSFIYQGAYMISKVDLLEYLADHSEEQGVRHYRIKNGGQS